ncbi:putative membrane-associated kinase regulator 5 [Bienertia sinuspersici]
MEVLTMLKFWKSNISKVAAGTSDCAETVTDSTISDHLTEDSDDDDSFFELELPLPSNDSKYSLSSPYSKTFEDTREVDHVKSKSKPQSPISILRAASPKLRVFMFRRFNKKSKRVVEDEEFFETESISSSYSPKRSSSNLFTVKFKIEDGSIVPKFTRTCSNESSVTSTPKIDKQFSYNVCETSKRFSKDVVQKYLGLMKPKSSKKCDDGEKFVASPTRSSMTLSSIKKEKDEKQSSRFKVKCKQLGKCKSSSAMIGVQPPTLIAARNDCPQDGIEGAILHCKRSLTPSKGYSSLSRCSSDPSHEKSIQVSEII